MNSPFPFIRGHDGSTPDDLRGGVLSSLRQQETPLFTAFFSQRNMNELQVKLRESIQKKSGFVIDKQKDEEFVIIMRYIYMEYADHGRKVDLELVRLNDLVLREAVPIVGSSIAQHLSYLRDASQIPEPLPRGVATTVKGSNALQLFRAL